MHLAAGVHYLFGSCRVDFNRMIRFENISKQYREGSKSRQVLTGASAEFGLGEFTAIIGQSGSGKSTLLNLLSGIDMPDSGKIWFGDQELTRYSEQERTLFRRRQIGFVFQFFNLIATLNTWENILLPLELQGKPSPAQLDRAKMLLTRVGLQERAKTYPDRLSGGEQQRVAIARALVTDPQLVLADEPTGNLDAETGERVLRLLDELTRQAGKNLIMVTHSLESARMADRILRLHDGQLLPKVD
jgi:putative ABC transport system ATP-binding protein